MKPPCQVWLGSIAAAAHTRFNQPVKLGSTSPEDDLPLLPRALEHYAADLEAPKRPDARYLALAEELKRERSHRRRTPGRRSQLSAGRDESRRTLALARQPAARIGSASAPNIDVRVWNLRHARYIPPFASIGGVNGVARTSGFRTIRPVLVCTMPKKKSPAKKQRSPRSAATPACPCCLCGWVYVVNDGSGKPQVRRSCPAGVKVTQVQPGEYIVTFPTIKKVLAPVATLNNSVGTITVVPLA